MRATEAKATQAVTSHGATQAGNECQRPHRPRSHEGAEPHRQATKAEATQAEDTARAGHTGQRHNRPTKP